MDNLNIEKEKTALVVIDLQKRYVERTGAEPYDAVSVVANSAKLADTFRKNKMPVVNAPDGSNRAHSSAENKIPE